jgi:arylformamidase
MGSKPILVNEKLFNRYKKEDVMKIIDISWPINASMTEYKNRKSVRIDAVKNFKTDSVRESVISFHSHTGTHIDAQSHFLENGTTIESVDLDSVVGTCRVLDLTEVEKMIVPEHLEKHKLCAGERILLKTRNSFTASDAPFDTQFVFVSKEAAAFCADKKIRTIGIDYLGIERNQPHHETHTIFFNAGITIVEGLRLAIVAQGTYQFVCLPLLTPGIDAAPARAILIG